MAKECHPEPAHFAGEGSAFLESPKKLISLPQIHACLPSNELPYDTGMRLLLVEDDARIARFVAKGLREESYAVDAVENGNDAVYQTEINDYDLIVLDVMIPGMDGFAVCKAIRASGKRTPILMLTAKDGVDDRIKGLDSGADDYLTKPFEFRELLARLRALLRRPNELRPPRIVVGDLELDTASQTAKRVPSLSPLRNTRSSNISPATQAA
jgi:DNA-binding response OmpR family regulator